MRNKLGNAKTITADGIVHDSQKEAIRWSELKLMERVGEIRNLKRQVRYELIPKQEGERAVVYIADFVYEDARTGETMVEDVKGYRNPSSATYAKFVMKRKMMLYFHGIKVREV